MLLKFNIYNSHQFKIKIKNRDKFMKIFKTYYYYYNFEIIIFVITFKYFRKFASVLNFKFELMAIVYVKF